MDIWTLLLVLGFVAMIAMHLRGHGGHGHGGHRGSRARGQVNHSGHEDAASPRQREPVGAEETRPGHGGHRHEC